MASFVPLLLCVVFVAAVTSADGAVCATQSLCLCDIDPTTKIDLTPLSNKNVIAKDVQGKYDFYYNPCKTFVKENCSNVLVCRSNSLANENLGIGGKDGAQFIKKGNDYAVRYVENNRTSTVVLKCSKDADSPSLVVKSTNSTSYNFELTSKYACPTSTGTTTTIETTPKTTNKPTGSTTPKKPTGSTTPKKPTGSTTPKKPTGSTKPKPTGSTTPKKPTGSTTPKKPTGSTKPKPTGSTKPKPTGSTTPKKPTGSTKPKPTGSTKPKPTGSSTPKTTGTTHRLSSTTQGAQAIFSSVSAGVLAMIVLIIKQAL